MPRPYWSGQLQISLVSFGIKIFPATNPASEVSFHQIDRKTGERIHHQNVIEGGKPVEPSEIIKGYEYRKGSYVPIEPEEIKNLRIKTKDAIEIGQFVEISEIPLSLFEKPYFVVPKDKANSAAFAVVRKAMEQEHKAGLGKVAFAGREHLIALVPSPEMRGGGMMAYTLRFADELRNAADYEAGIEKQKIDEAQLKMARQLIDTYSAPLDLKKFKDEYETALRRLVEARIKNRPLPQEPAEPQKGKVIHLMDALRQSLERSAARPSGSTRRTARSKTGLKLVKPKHGSRKSA